MEQVISSDYIQTKSIKERLQTSPLILFVLYVSFSSFVVYGCMYGFRKPFTAATYAGYSLFGISYKVILVISQVVGYMISKFYGIKFIATMKPENRAVNILLLISISWLSLLFFAIIPFPYNFIFMFINGLPLGMVWGLVFGFLEGRKLTELMGAVLATSFIFASGLAKTVGKWILLHLHVNEWWMPFFAGAVFIFPLAISVWLLQQTPPPTEEDKANRSYRKPMDEKERKEFVKKFGVILAPVVLAYSLLTILRDFCEDFANELWVETGFQNNANIFTQTSTFISLLVLVIIGSFFLIRDNYKAFQLTYVVIFFGFILAVTSTILFQFHFISPLVWFVAATSGLYMGYVPYNCLYFERMLATFKVKGNVGFVMYIADAFGYLGTVFVLLLKEFVPLKYSWVNFFSILFYVFALLGVCLIIIASRLSVSAYKKFHLKV